MVFDPTNPTHLARIPARVRTLSEIENLCARAERDVIGHFTDSQGTVKLEGWSENVEDRDERLTGALLDTIALRAVYLYDTDKLEAGIESRSVGRQSVRYERQPFSYLRLSPFDNSPPVYHV